MLFSKAWRNNCQAVSDRYDRQIRLDDIGIRGQEKLQQAAILLIGAGGIGSSAAYYLAAAGVGRLGIMDSDTVEPSNLNRQILHRPDTVGIPKAASARSTLAAFNPETRINIYLSRLSDPSQAENIINNFDLVLDCTDNVETRYVINQACIQAKKPWIYAAVSELEGQIMTILPGQSPCFECLYPSLAPTPEDPSPVLGVTPGILGVLQATEALKWITGVGRLLTGKLLFADISQMHFETMTITRNETCPACSRLTG